VYPFGKHTTFRIICHWSRDCKIHLCLCFCSCFGAGYLNPISKIILIMKQYQLRMIKKYCPL